MITLKTEELIHSSAFVREPVDEEVNKILSSRSRKFIITGGRGVGKSVLLKSIEARGLGSKEQTIYADTDILPVMTTEPNERYGIELFQYLYELRFSLSLLLYIQRHYPIIYEKHFRQDLTLVGDLINTFNKEVGNFGFTNTPISCKYAPKELSSIILNKFLEIMKIKKINLAIDRFDRINGSSKCVQEIYKGYFDMFNKVIITTDDLNLDKQRLSKKGYKITTITYGKDPDVLREIIRRRVQLNNFKNMQEKISEDVFTLDTFIDRLAKEGNDIDFSLLVLKEALKDYKWHDSKTYDQSIVDEAFNDAKHSDQAYKLSLHNPTLYL